MYRIEVQQPAP